MLPSRIRTLRTAAKMSQRVLAEQLKVTQQTIAGWEMGRTSPDRHMLAQLAQIFDVSTDYLLGLTEDEVSISGAYLSMARQLRDSGISSEDLSVLLQARKLFLRDNTSDDE